MNPRRRIKLVRGVSTLILVAMATAGVVALSGGLAERKDANALKAADSVFVDAVGTVKADAGHTDWSQMPVRFDTVDGTTVETMIWTHWRNRDFHAGETVDVEYVAQRPTAARLADGQGGAPKPMTTILVGAGILVGCVILVSAWTWDAVTQRRRRRREA